MDRNSEEYIQRYEDLKLFRHGSVMIFKWENDPAMTIRSVSRNVEDILGYETDKFTDAQISFNELLHPDDHDRIYREHEIFLKSGGQECENKTYRLLSRSGEDIWVHAYTVIIYDNAGKLDYFLSHLIDITKQVLAERALKQSEEMYRTLLDSQQNAVFLHKLLPQGFAPFTEVNRYAIEHYGYSREEFLQLSPPDITIFAGGRHTANPDIRKKLHDDGRLEFEVVHIKKSGERFPVRVSSVVVELNGEKYIMSTALDMTAQKKAERESKLSNARLMTVLNSIDASIYVSDMQTHEILFMNENMVREFGQDFTGESCWKVFRGESSPCGFCTNDLLLDATGQPTGLKVWQGRNPLTQKYYINYDRAIQWIDGSMVKLQIAMDITELKSMEEQLRQKFKMEAVGVMAGGVAHDFNNNLAIILGNVELAELKMKMPPDSDIRKHLEDAKVAITRARDLVQQILTYSRQEAQPLKPVRLRMVIEETLKLLRSTIPSTVKIDLQAPSGALTVLADSTQVQEILINLCNNAVYAMEEHGVISLALDRVEVVHEEEIPVQFSATPGSYARISVTDNGRGMETDLLERIFDPFFTTKEVGQGTGMGLAVVHGILTSHGGFARVASTPGQGSCFEIFLPVTTEHVETEEITTAVMPHGHEQILFVDDEEMLTAVGSQMLAEHGYKVTTAASGEEALRLFKEQPDRFDLVISDQTMPDLTGKQLVEELLKIRPDLPTIICTGYSEQIDEQGAAAIGVKAFCMKPLNMAELIRTTRRVLG